MFALVLVSLDSVLTAAQGTDDSDLDFDGFVQKFKKTYKDGVEKENRRKFYNQRMQEIKKLNSEEKNGVVYGVTRMSDISPE